MFSYGDIIAPLERSFPACETRAPATDAAIETFGRIFLPVPGDLAAFLRISNGLDLHRDDPGHIYGLAEIQRVLGIARQLRKLRMIPIRGDGCGNYDCVDASTRPTRGAVVFCESYARPQYLLGGTFTSYLAMWSDAMRAGERTHPWPFDERWMRARDPRAGELLDDPSLRPWLAADASGRDEPTYWETSIETQPPLAAMRVNRVEADRRVTELDYEADDFLFRARKLMEARRILTFQVRSPFQALLPHLVDGAFIGAAPLVAHPRLRPLAALAMYAESQECSLRFERQQDRVVFWLEPSMRR